VRRGGLDIISISDRVERAEAMSEERAARIARLASVRAWASVFAPVAASDLEGFDLVVLGGMTAAGSSCLPDAEVRTLQSQGILALAHMPLVSSERDGSAAVRQWVSTAHNAIDNGFDGLYLDDLVPDQQSGGVPSGLEGVVRSIRDCCPDGLLLAQRSPIRWDAALVDGVGHDRPLRGTP
jgi:hypothetical protein